MEINIDLQNLDKVLNRLNFDWDDLNKALISNISNEMEINAKQNIDQRIYAQPPSPRYIRTGKAKKGILKFKKGTQGQVLADTTLAGAGKNYTPFLNKNSKITKLNTNFWDDAVEKTKQETPKIAKEILKKFLKK